MSAGNQAVVTHIIGPRKGTDGDAFFSEFRSFRGQKKDLR